MQNEGLKAAHGAEGTTPGVPRSGWRWPEATGAAAYAINATDVIDTFTASVDIMSGVVKQANQT